MLADAVIASGINIEKRKATRFTKELLERFEELDQAAGFKFGCLPYFSIPPIIGIIVVSIILIACSQLPNKRGLHEYTEW